MWVHRPDFRGDQGVATPAFILGNGPLLPVADLDCLANRFTIGVNRIVQVFTPTVVMWVDGTVYKAVGKEIDESGALLVCDRSVAHRQFHIGLKTHVGDAALVRESLPTELCCNGNTGCMAARWALALGCFPVFILGMSAEYHDGKTDFYGKNPRHRFEGMAQTLGVIRAELNRLLRDFPDRDQLCPIPDGIMLREVAAEFPDVDQDTMRLMLKARLGA